VTNREREILTGSLMRSFETSVIFFSFLGIEILAKFVEFTLEKRIPQFLCQKMAKSRQEIITLVPRRGHLITMKLAKLEFFTSPPKTVSI